MKWYTNAELRQLGVDDKSINIINKRGERGISIKRRKRGHGLHAGSWEYELDLRKMFCIDPDTSGSYHGKETPESWSEESDSDYKPDPFKADKEAYRDWSKENWGDTGAAEAMGGHTFDKLIDKQFTIRSKYYSEVDWEKMQVVAFLSNLTDRPLRVTFELDKKIHRLYSDMTKPQFQIKEVADEVGWPVYIMEAYLKARGLTHKSSIWADWEIASKDMHNLQEDYRVAAERSARLIAERAMQKEVEADAQKWRKKEEAIRDLIASIEIEKADQEVHSPIPVVYENPRLAMVVGAQDIHIGVYDWNHGDNTLSVSEKRYHDMMEQFLSRARRLGKLDSIIILFGADFWNVTNRAGGTENGTRQNTPGGIPFMQYEVGWYAYERTFEELRRLDAEIVVAGCYGNHDWTYAKCAYFHFAEKFGHLDEFQFIPSPHGRGYYKYGSNILAWDHGDKLKIKDYPGIMDTECPHLLDGARHKYMHTGHIHQERVHNWPGTGGRSKTFVVESISMTNYWAARNYGARGPDASQAYLYHPEHGIRDTMRVYFEQDVLFANEFVGEYLTEE